MPAAVLLIEDNPITAKLVRFTLEHAKYRVLEATDGARGLELFVEHRPQLVLLDMLLPDIDGFAMFRQLRALPGGSGVPILAFSGLLTEFNQARLAEVGFDDVVSKPIEPHRLVQIVEGYLPAATQPAPAVTTVMATGTTATAVAGRTLVVADDDAVQRKMVGLRLQRAGYRVVMAVDGEEALARARAERPYAIVSDVLMPKMDGFGLCMAVRNDPQLERLPVVLISNSYLEVDDHSLAARVGADALLERTPELTELIATLDKGIARRERPRPMTSDLTLERERLSRVMSQLEKQVELQASLSQRCSLLSAELSVLKGISEAVATEHDIDVALGQILSSCLDAGGISIGMLYLRDGDGLQGLKVGARTTWSDEDLATFFGCRGALEKVIANQTLVTIPSSGNVPDEYRPLFERTNAKAIAIAPLGHRGQPLGALVTMSHMHDNVPADSVKFAQAVAGQISLSVALARSFQAKDRSESEARQHASVLRSILDSMAEGVVVSDEHARVTHWNDAATTILHAPTARLEGSVLGRADSPMMRALDGEAVDHSEMLLKSESEAEDDRWLSISARPLGEPGASNGAVAVFRDVTIEKEASARLLVSERLASLGTLAAGVGHEINNPLMAVLGNLDMAMADLRQAQRERTDCGFLEAVIDELQDARGAAERVRDIFSDLKIFSRSDEETRGSVDVQHVLESSIRMVWNEIRHRATFVRELEPVPMVYANESRLGQVFLNLIVNAAQAIPDGRASENTIRVATAVDKDGRVRISVGDTGCGMPPEIVAKIFTPFFTTKPIGIGTGLGLAICHQIVTGLGGEIELDTEPGRGTTFHVLLPPVVEAGVASADEIAIPRTRTGARRGRILVIDDEAVIATTIKRCLMRDHDVITTQDPHEAVRLVRSGKLFDAILCDLMMPDITGMDVFEQLTEVAPDQAARMIFITGGAFTAAARAFLDRTKNEVIEKPIDVAGLRAVVSERVRTIDRKGVV